MRNWLTTSYSSLATAFGEGGLIEFLWEIRN